MSEIVWLPNRSLENLNKKCPVPRQYIKQNSRDKHDFNDKYILAVTYRINFLRHHHTLPKKVRVITKMSGFWVDVRHPGFPKHRLRKNRL